MRGTEDGENAGLSGPRTEITMNKQMEDGAGARRNGGEKERRRNEQRYAV